MARINPKFASQVNDDLWLAHDYGKIYSTEITKEGTKRLHIAVSHEGSEILRTLSQSLTEPFFLLYVLVVARGSSEEGRYQSEELSHKELDGLFDRYSEFWDGDGRHSVWLRSEADDATLVYDRHNLIYAYGPIQRFELVLETLGYTETPKVSLSFKHQHHYYPEFDALAEELTTKLTERKSDLQPGDENPI